MSLSLSIRSCLAILFGLAVAGSALAEGLTDDPVWEVTGSASSQFAFSVSAAGDVNNDGFADVILGEPGHAGGAGVVGRALVYHGSMGGLSTGATWTEEGPGGSFGWSVAGAGDVNGDGFADVIVGAPNYGNGQSFEGAAFVYYGGVGGLAGTPAWSYESDEISLQAGYVVAGAGDVNGDGYDDVLLGTDSGKALVFHGSASGLSAAPDWSVNSIDPSREFGVAVASAGDVNGDGYDDVIVGEPDNFNDSGAAYVYHGSQNGLAAAPSWNVEFAEGTVSETALGETVSSAGDVNGDGYDDVIVGDWLYDADPPSEEAHGAGFVYYGSAGGLATSPSWQVPGDFGYTGLGAAVASAGDVNVDGYDDVLVGKEEPELWLHLGSAGGPSVAPDWTASHVAVAFGRIIAGAGDVNGDGAADVILGNNSLGYARVYHGQPGIGTIEAVDPNPDLMVGNAVSFAKSILSRSFARQVTGYAADGATQVVLRIQVPGPGTVVWRIFNQNEVQTTSIGSLFEPGGSPTMLTELGVAVQQLDPPDGRHMAFVILHAPPDAETVGIAVDPMIIEAEYCTDMGGSCPSGGQTTRFDFELHRPPVVLFHGLYGDDTTFRWDDHWVPFHPPGIEADDAAYYVFKANYSGIHDRHFRDVVTYWRTAIVNGGIRAMRHDRGIAVTRAFVFAHSMGAPVTRLYIASNEYLRNDNFSMGDILGFVSVAGVHLGSVFAEQLWDLQNTPGIGPKAADYARKAGFCIDCGAIEDLRYSSPVIRNLPGTPGVPAHAVYGSGGTDIQFSLIYGILPYKLEYPIKVLQLFDRDPGDLLIGGCKHDGVLFESTQKGALGDPDDTSRMSYDNNIIDPQYALHWTLAQEWQTNLRAADLMLESIESPCVDCPEWSLQGFPDNASLPATAFTECVQNPSPAAVTLTTGNQAASNGPIELGRGDGNRRRSAPVGGAGGVVITAPSPGSAVTPGSMITVTIEATGGFPISRASAATSLRSLEFTDVGPPWELQLFIPEEAIGPITLSALALGGPSNELVAVADDVVLNTDLGGATLMSVSASPDPLILTSHTTQLELQVLGSYTDGVVREISSAVHGTSYLSQTTEIATVSQDGRVGAAGLGQTGIDISNGGFSTTVTVLVEGVQLDLSWNGQQLTWPEQAHSIGYDIVVGDLDALRASGGDFSNAVTACVGEDILETTLTHPADPPSGSGLFFLTRNVVSEESTGSYDTHLDWIGSAQVASRDGEIAAAPASCF